MTVARDTLEFVKVRDTYVVDREYLTSYSIGEHFFLRVSDMELFQFHLSGFSGVKLLDDSRAYPRRIILFMENMEMSTVSRVVKIGLRTYGIWPYLPSTALCRLLCIMLLSAAQIFQYRYLLINYRTDSFSNFMDGMSSAMTYSLLFMKLAILWINER